jgi:hypothetical protein
MGVFMEPVFNDLIDAWEKGVLTYDRATKRNDGDEDDGEEVQNATDLALLERLRFGIAIDDNDGDEAEMLDNIASDDDTCDLAAADPEDYFKFM